MAKTNEQRATGLMYRKSLPDGQGMLFDFAPEQEVAMWMKNTYVSLDMIFIRADGRIHRIAERTKTESTDIIPSGGPVRAVLEVVAGTAQKYGIAVGDKVGHPLFRAPVNLSESGPGGARACLAGAGRRVYRPRNTGHGV